MKEKTIKALIEMGMNAELNGFSYIVDAMRVFESDGDTSVKTIELYQKLADMNNSTISRVERCIRHAFQTVLIKGNPDAVEKYLMPRGQFTNGHLLHVLYLRLTSDEE